MGEKAKVNTALGILGVTGLLVIFSAIERAFHVPAELWGLATGSSVYLFSTARSDRRNKKEDDDDVA